MSRANDFQEDRYSWSEQQRRRARQESVWWRRHVVWIAQHSWPARICLILFYITAIYLAFVFGMLIGVGLATGKEEWQ